MQSFQLAGKISCQNSVFYSRIEVGVGGGDFWNWKYPPLGPRIGTLPYSYCRHDANAQCGADS